MDLHSYAKKCDEIRKDFKKLIASQDNSEVDAMLEKYEFYIENSYKINVYTRKETFLIFKNKKELIFNLF